jgi:AcrR family transcriptional regulator
MKTNTRIVAAPQDESRVDTTEMVEPLSAPARKRNSARTRAALMKAALKEFSEQGYSGARIDQIAKSARCNIRMLYHYFGSKKKLYVAALESAYADLRQKEATLSIDSEQPLEGMMELMDFTFTYFQSNPMFEGLLRAENMMKGKFVSRSTMVPEGATGLKQTIKALIASGQAKGLFRDDLDPLHIYVTMTALSRFHLANSFTMSAVLGVDMRDKAWRAKWLEHCRLLLRTHLLR